jgi:hypothetical protein
VWHERWGEDYDGQGGCVKYTDKVREGLRCAPGIMHAICFKGLPPDMCTLMRCML